MTSTCKKNAHLTNPNIRVNNTRSSNCGDRHFLLIKIVRYTNKPAEPKGVNGLLDFEVILSFGKMTPVAIK